jgi:hypothetical protein
MYAMLATTKTTETFNAEYYIAIVTVLPILMLAIEVLTNFEKLISGTRPSSPRMLPLWLVLAFFYVFSPIIAAAGVILGALALIYRDTNAAFQWITFSCLAGVLGFLAIASTIYLIAVDYSRYKREAKAEAEAEAEKDTLNSSGPTP